MIRIPLARNHTYGTRICVGKFAIARVETDLNYRPIDWAVLHQLAIFPFQGIAEVVGRSQTDHPGH